MIAGIDLMLVCVDDGVHVVMSSFLSLSGIMIVNCIGAVMTYEGKLVMIREHYFLYRTTVSCDCHYMDTPCSLCLLVQLI